MTTANEITRSLRTDSKKIEISDRILAVLVIGVAIVGEVFYIKKGGYYVTYIIFGMLLILMMIPYMCERFGRKEEYEQKKDD